MPNAHEFLQNLALVFCVAAVTTVVFHRLRQPVVFGYLLAGMIVGPHIPIPLVADENMVHTLSELGVILLMFSLGLEFSIRRVVTIAGTSGLAALAETSVMFGLGFLAARALGLTTTEGIFAGAMVSISSTTIIVKAFGERAVSGRVREVVFGILIVEDLIAILLIASLTAVAADGELSAGGFARTGVRLAMFLAVLIGFGLLTIPRIMRGILRGDRDEVTLVASVGICFAAALFALRFGYSVALGAFIAGSLVAESGGAKTIERLIQPVRDLFVAIFFVAAGMLIDPRAVADHWPIVVALTVVVIVGKLAAVTAAAFLAGNGLRSSVQAGMSLGQIGEFSFIIASVGTATGAIRPFLYPVAIAVSAITTLTTPLLIRAAVPAAMFVDRKLPKSLQTFVGLYGSWIDRLREDTPRAGGKLRINRLVRLVALDTVLLALLIVGSATEAERITPLLRDWLGLSESFTPIVILVLSALVAIPLLAALASVTWRLALALAVRALPATGSGVDFARAPRTALVTTLHIAILLAVGTPLIVLMQLVLPSIPALILLTSAVIALGIAFWRSTRDLHGHVRAGAQIIVSALASQTNRSSDELTKTMEHMNTMLPGLGEPTPVVLDAQSPAVGRTLAQLNLRGMTGATVLCISRPTGSGQEEIVPSGHERLEAGDVIALAGPHDAVESAREILQRST